MKRDPDRQYDTSERNWLVFSDDWGRHPSSCQYIMRELLPKVQITWVNTIGTRTPRLDLATFRRVAGKLRRMADSNVGSPSSEAASPNGQPQVANPVMWPWFARRHDRWINRKLMSRHLARIIRTWPRPRVAVTTIPIVADLIGELDIDLWVYYCVDDFSEWPGLDQKTMLEMERELVRKVDKIVVVSEVLQRRLEDMGRESQLLTHGVDVDRWSVQNVSRRFAWPDEILEPVALFWGVIDPRLDSEFVIEIARKLDLGSLVFVGPQQHPEAKLRELSNVHFLDPVSPDELPPMAKAAACLIMPYQDTAVTRAMQPLKLKEYLATGRPVVARDLPATRPWGSACDLATSASQFSDQVNERIRTGLPAKQSSAREELANEAWSAKAETFFRMVSS